MPADEQEGRQEVAGETGWLSLSSLHITRPVCLIAHKTQELVQYLWSSRFAVGSRNSQPVHCLRLVDEDSVLRGAGLFFLIEFFRNLPGWVTTSRGNSSMLFIASGRGAIVSDQPSEDSPGGP